MKLHCLCLGQHEVFQEKRPLLPLSNSPPRTGKKDQHFWFWGLSCIGEGNGNPLQCSCLENPRDRGAWWAAVYGVAQSRTRLKRLSSILKVTDLPFTLTYIYRLLLSPIYLQSAGFFSSCQVSFFFFFFNFYVFLAALGLHRCTWACASCGSQASHWGGFSWSTGSRVCGLQ